MGIAIYSETNNYMLNMTDYNRINRLILPLFGVVIENTLIEPPAAIKHQGRGVSQHNLKKLAVNFKVDVSPDALYAFDTIREFVFSRNSQQKHHHFAPGTMWDMPDALDVLIKHTKMKEPLETDAHQTRVTVTTKTKEELIKDCNSLLRREATRSPLQALWVTLSDAFDILDCLEAPIEPTEVTNPAAKYAMIWRQLSAIGPLEENMAPIDVLNAAILRSGARCRFSSITSSVRNEQIVTQIKRAKVDVSLQFAKYGAMRLASVYNQHKLLFLAFKQSHANNKLVVNQISRLAKKHNVTNPLCVVTSRALDRERDHELLSGSDGRTLLQAWTACNAAVWTPSKQTERCHDKLRPDDIAHEEAVKAISTANRDILFDYITASLRQKVGYRSVYSPNHHPKLDEDFGLPLSEKQMVGNVHFGAYLVVKSPTVTVGILNCPEYIELLGATFETLKTSQTAPTSAKYTAQPARDASLATVTAHSYGLVDWDTYRLVFSVRNEDKKPRRIHLFAVRGQVTNATVADTLLDPSKTVFQGDLLVQPGTSPVGVVFVYSDHSSIWLKPSRAKDSPSERGGVNSVYRESLPGLGLRLINFLRSSDYAWTPEQHAEFDLSPNGNPRDFYRLILS